MEWVTYILEHGFEVRKQDPYFMLSLFREDKPFEGFWNYVIAEFGTPQIYNSEYKRFFSAPYILKATETKIEPMFLLSLREVSKTLFEGNSSCDLFECCKNAKIGPEVNYNCKTQPWLWGQEEKTCAYGAQWQLFGLNKKTLEFE